MPSATSRKNWLRRLGWLALIWAASVIALAIVAMVFRLLMGLVGLTEMFQEHAENNIPMESGEVFMWSAKRRKVYTLSLASHEYEPSEDRILRTLEAKMGSRSDAALS